MSVVPHLLTVWNPLYDDDPVRKHLEMLERFQSLVREDEMTLAERFVWWGKIRSSNKAAGDVDPGLDAMRRTQAWLAEHPDEECHLYLTDYRSLYVGHLRAIRMRGELDRDAETDWIPPYYLGREVDGWFCLSDLRLLIADDLRTTASELRALANPAYHGKPISLYGGIRDLPMVVHRTDQTSYFDEADRQLLLGDRIWAEEALDHGALIVERSQDLRDNVFGVELWTALDQDVRVFTATADQVYRNLKAVRAADFAPSLVNFSKAVERQLRTVLAHLLQGSEDPQAVMLYGGPNGQIDLRTGGQGLMFGALVAALPEMQPRMRQALEQALAKVPADRSWFLHELFPLLVKLAKVRGPGAHEVRISAEVARDWRSKLLGVGCDGVLVRLARIMHYADPPRRKRS